MYIKQLPKPKPWKSAEEIETTDSNWKKRTDVHHADVRGRLNGYLTTLGEMLWMVDGLPLGTKRRQKETRNGWFTLCAVCCVLCAVCCVLCAVLLLTHTSLSSYL